jgi:ribonuclease D
MASSSKPNATQLAFFPITYMSEKTESPKLEARQISKAEINQLPLIAWDGPIEILNTIEEMTAAVEKLKNEVILGFDTETRPTFKKGDYYPPALIQLSSADCVYLFRISETKTLAPLLLILESEKILKTGVAIKDDVKELRAMEDFSPAGFIEITDVTLKLGYENRGLRALSGLILGGRISKAAQVSNWARPELEKKQIHYAATDAWISRELYVKSIAERDGAAC